MILTYIDNETDHIFICETKMEALKKVKSFFADTQRNKPIPYSLVDNNNKVLIDCRGFEQLQECYDFFKENPSYGTEIDSKIAESYYNKEFK